MSRTGGEETYKGDEEVVVVRYRLRSRVVGMCAKRTKDNANEKELCKGN